MHSVGVEWYGDKALYACMNVAYQVLWARVQYVCVVACVCVVVGDIFTALFQSLMNNSVLQRTLLKQAEQWQAGLSPTGLCCTRAARGPDFTWTTILKKKKRWGMRQMAESIFYPLSTAAFLPSSSHIAVSSFLPLSLLSSFRNPAAF